jgi:hypothetical protein
MIVFILFPFISNVSQILHDGESVKRLKMHR